MQAGSLIISVFGDALFPRGGGIWVGSLAKLLEPLALSERLVRTALFRLVKEDWLQPQVRGRRSDYFLSPTGQHRIAEASRHIYANTDPVWDQRWRLILIAGELQPKEREALRSALFWHGFGSLSPAVFIHPSAELGTAFDALLDEGLGSLRKSLLPMLAGELGFAGAASSADVVKRAWDLDQLGLRYASFVQTYQPLLEVARLHGAQAATDADQDGIDDQSAFLLRVLLIHDYRRLLLRDPGLPAALIPPGWPGKTARLLCQELYRRLWAGSERHLDLHCRLADGSMPAPNSVSLARFQATDPLGLKG